MEQMSLFDMEESAIQFDVTKKLQVVKSKFLEAQSVSWQDLFEGFDEMYAITFSSGIQFMSQLLQRFEYAEVIFGCEGLVDDNVAAIMAVERTLIEKITKNKSAMKMCEKMEAEELRLYVSRDIKSHEKVFCLRAKDGRTRVITGSANMSASAFCGIQRENITYYDDEEAYRWYRERFDSFKEACSDNVNQTVMMRTIEDEGYLEEHPEEIPIIKTIEKKNMVIIEKSEEDSDDTELVVSVKGLEAELKPMLPKPKKSEGKIILTSELMQKFKRSHKEHVAQKKEQRKMFPKLHIDYETEKLSFNGRECNLNPDPAQVRNDISCLVSYLSSLNSFYGDVQQAQRDYYAFMNWYFASLFMPYLRYMANKNSYEVTLFPVVGIIYGESNGGKSTFLRMLSKLMCNAKIPLNATSDFSASNIEKLRCGCEGVPLNIDDLDKDQFRNHSGRIIKDDVWGIAEHFINYPAIAITTNKLPSLEDAISKRAIGCRINAKIDKEAGIRCSKMINESIRNITNSLYCEYVRRMFPKIADIVEHMKLGNVDYLPDIFATSSEVLLEIISEFAPDLKPDYFEVLCYSDYFGEKVVGRNAINKIINAWENERKQFTIDKKKNKLIYSYPDGALTHELKYICDELPPKLKAKVASRSLVMELDMACEFFDIKFKKSIF